jgi:hypothetical protein
MESVTSRVGGHHMVVNVGRHDVSNGMMDRKKRDMANEAQTIR